MAGPAQWWPGRIRPDGRLGLAGLVTEEVLDLGDQQSRVLGNSLVGPGTLVESVAGVEVYCRPISC